MLLPVPVVVWGAWYQSIGYCSPVRESNRRLCVCRESVAAGIGTVYRSWAYSCIYLVQTKQCSAKSGEKHGAKRWIWINTPCVSTKWSQSNPKQPSSSEWQLCGIKKTLLHVHSKQSRHGKRPNAYSSNNKSCSSS